MKQANTTEDDSNFEFDFKPITVTITLTNLSTQNTITTQNTPSLMMIEFVDHGFKLQTPANFCNKKHHVEISLEVNDSKKSIRLLSECLVKKRVSTRTISYHSDEQVDLQESEVDVVTLALTRCDLKMLEEFKKVFESRQSNIDQYFNLVKGLPV